MDAQKFNRLIRKIKYDANAVQEIYDEYFQKLKTHLKRVCGNYFDSADIVQDAFLKLLQLENIPYVKSPTTWLYKLAENCAIDLLRRQRTEMEITDRMVFVEFDLENTILGEEVKNAMAANLDPLSQEILYMYHWEGYQLREIAAELKVNYGNVRQKASRACKLLKKFL